MSVEPVSFEMVAAQLRLGDDTSEQALIEGYIAAAREWVEDYTGHIVAQRTVTDYFDAFDWRLRLSRRPVVEISAIDYLDGEGAAASYLGHEVRVRGMHAYAHPANEGWPRGYKPGSIAVEYLAGYEPLEVPQRFIQAILVLAADFYRTRSSFSKDAQQAAMILLKSFRAVTL